LQGLKENKTARRILKALGVVMVLVLVLPWTLYIPAVQRVAKDYACDYASKKTGLAVKMDRVLLKFPLSVSMDGFSVLDQARDTMLRVANLTTGVEVLPMLHSDFKIGSARLTHGYYRMVSEDSAMCLTADIDHCVLMGTDLDLNHRVVNVVAGEMSGGRIQYAGYPDRKKEKPDSDTAAAKPWRVNAIKFTLRDVDFTMRQLPTIDKMHAHVGYARLLDGRVNTGDCTVDVRSLSVDKVKCSYYAMSARDAALYERLHPTPVDTSKSQPWAVRADTLRVHHLDYNMQMLPTIDVLKTTVVNALLVEGEVNTEIRNVTVSRFAVDSLDARYFTPTAKVAAATAVPQAWTLQAAPTPTPDTGPWTVTCDTLQLSGSHALYATSRHKAVKGLDPSYIEVSNVNLAVHNLYNRGTTVSVPLQYLRAKERCGIEIENAHGTLAMHDGMVDIDKFGLKTFMSRIYLDAHGPMTLLNKKPTGQFRVSTNSQIALQEIAMMLPRLKPMFKMVPQYNPVALRGSLAGTPSRINIKTLTAEIPKYARVAVSGGVSNPLEPARLSGNVAFDATVTNADFIKPTLLDKAQQRQLNIPPMALNGRVHFDAKSNVAGNVAMRLAGGRAVGQGSFSANSQRYNVDATFVQFPVKKILPLAPADNLTAHVTASGHGFDFLKASTAVNAKVDLGGVTYRGQRYEHIQAQVNMNGGIVKAQVVSHNKDCDLNLTADGTIQGNHYVMAVNGVVNDLDAQKFGLVDVPCRGGGKINGSFDYNATTQYCDLKANLTDLDWNYDGNKLVSKSTDVRFASNADTVSAYVDNEDTHLDFVSQCNLKQFTKRLNETLGIAQKQYKARYLDINSLQEALPKFVLDLRCGPNGIIPRYVARYNVDFRDINCQIRNDSTIYMNGYVHQLSVGDRAIDTLRFHANEQDDKYLTFDVHMGNAPGTWDDFAQVDVAGGALGSTLDFMVVQHNLKGEMGYQFGANATLDKDEIKARLFPTQPVIGYRTWEINPDNYFNFNYKTRMLDVDFLIKNDSSSLALKSEKTDDPNKEKILLNISNLKLDQWTTYVPALPVMSGTVNGNVNVLYDGRNMDGDGLVKIKDFAYNGTHEGDVAIDTKLSVDPATMATKLNATLSLDGSKVALAYGVLNDSTSRSPMNMNVQLDRFPLQKASAFIPGYYVALDGYIDGEMHMTGTTAKPEINGYVQGDSAVVSLPAYGCSLRLDTSRIVVDNSLLRLDGTKFYGLNDSPIYARGQVDLSTMDMNLKFSGQNVQFIGTKQQRWSEMFGACYGDLDASIVSKSGNMRVGASVNILPTSDITYVMLDEVDALRSSKMVDENMVTFVNPADTTHALSKLVTGEATSSLDLNINIAILQGAKFNVYLTQDGKSRVTTKGTGKLRYTLDFAGKDNLVGSYTIKSGEVRYTPPVISQKVFEIAEGSSISWTGEMMNPMLNLTGTDKLRATVNSSSGTSRVVDFLVTAMIKDNLNHMNVSFDLATTNDADIENELQGMTAAQRSAAAINLLLYNTYSSEASANNPELASANNALFSFIQSQLNNWAANNLHGIDLSFGINSYESQSGSSTSDQMSYSYRLSKTLFNDRLKVVVGGEYSTDATQQNNFADNLFNNISIEYNLNRSGNMMVKLFRSSGIESILEGTVTQTGAAFVMKRKIGNMKDFFWWRKNKQTLVDTTIRVAPKLQIEDKSSGLEAPVASPVKRTVKE